MTREHPRTVEDLALWAAENDGRINALWEEQKATNGVFERRISAIGVRLGALEKRIVWLSGFAAAAGGLLGTFAQRYFAP